MRRQPFAALFLLTGVTAFLLASLSAGRDEPTAPAVVAVEPAYHGPVLPGIRPDGFVQLPNQWRLRPAGTQLELDNFPVNIAIHPDGRFLAVLHCGYRDHDVVIVGLEGSRPHVVSQATVEQAFYGLAFTPDGRRLFVSGGEYASFTPSISATAT